MAVIRLPGFSTVSYTTLLAVVIDFAGRLLPGILSIRHATVLNRFSQEEVTTWTIRMAADWQLPREGRC